MFSGKGEPLCRKVRGTLSEYIDNRLDGESKSLVERHLETCEACSHELASLRMTVQLLHRVPQVSPARSFKVTAPQPRRESAFGTAGMRWLRPATAIVAVALVVLLMGDFVFGFAHYNARSNSGPGTVTFSGAEASIPTPNPEQQIMVAIPGVMGQMSLATAKAVGYADYTVLRSVSGSAFDLAVVPPAPAVSDNETSKGAGVIATQSEAGTAQGWPLRQTEIGLGAAVFVLLALMIYARRQRREKVRAR